MPDTRRTFLQAAAAAAVGGAAVRAQAQGQFRGQAGGPPKPVSEVQVPKMKFGKVEISRLVAGCNPFYGYAHFNNTLSSLMTEWCTPDKVVATLHQCNRFGINAYNAITGDRPVSDLQRFQAEGGQMHLIVQGGKSETAGIVKTLNPLAIYHMGEVTDQLYHNGELENVKEWCKKARQLGVMVGVGSHYPEVLATVEDQGWDVDFLAGCVYNRLRTQDEWKQALNGELIEMSSDVYLKSDPARMYKVLRQSKKPCFAFKILAAGRIEGRAVDQAFQTAYQSIKPTDGVFIGLFPKFKDEVRENAERVRRLLAQS
jgi:hypothetical protein